MKKAVFFAIVVFLFGGVVFAISSNKNEPKNTLQNEYVNDVYGYSIAYPEAWLQLPNGKAPDSVAYFSNGPWGEAHPLTGVENQILVSIEVEENPNNLDFKDFFNNGVFYNPTITEVTELESYRRGGVDVLSQVEDSTRNTEVQGYYSIATYFKNDEFIYQVYGFSFTKEMFDMYEDEYWAMVDSFTIR